MLRRPLEWLIDRLVDRWLHTEFRHRIDVLDRKCAETWNAHEARILACLARGEGDGREREREEQLWLDVVDDDFEGIG